MTARLASLVLVTLLVVHRAAPVAAQTEGRAEPAGQLTWAINVALASTWFDAAESTGLLTAFIFYYALHDALVWPMPGKPMAPSVAAKALKDRVRQVHVVDAHRVRFELKEPWPDFLAFYATPATGAAWIVPRKYLEKVGDEGFKKAPVGAGPYRFVSFTPGVELALEAHEGYWRKA